jgi:hypothetical protein
MGKRNTCGVMNSISKIDILLSMGYLQQSSQYSMFIDMPEDRACSLTFIDKGESATVGLAFATIGAAMRLYNHKMKPVAQVPEFLTEEEFEGVRNTMIEIDRSMPSPPGV